MKKDFPKIIGLFMYQTWYMVQDEQKLFICFHTFESFFIEICLKTVYALDGRKKFGFF